MFVALFNQEDFVVVFVKENQDVKTVFLLKYVPKFILIEFIFKDIT